MSRTIKGAAEVRNEPPAAPLVEQARSDLRLALMRFVFAAELAEGVAARDGSRLGEGEVLRQASIWLGLRVLNRVGPCETSENPSDFHALSIVRHRHDR